MKSFFKQHVALATAVICALTGTSAVQASSHREAPFIAQMPKVDGTDFYLFRSYEPGRGDFVTLIANYQPLQDPYGGPNYFSLDRKALYEIHIDNDGDAKEDITFQFRFDNQLPGATLNVGGQDVAVALKTLGTVGAGNTSALNFSESYRVNMVTGDRRKGQRYYVRDAVSGAREFTKPFDYSGEKTFGDNSAYTDYLRSLTNSGDVYHDVHFEGCPHDAGSGRVFVGQRKESFSVNLGRVFDLINFDPINIVDDPANNQIDDKNITTLALEVPIACLIGDGNGVIGGWTTASKRQVQIMRRHPSFAKPEVRGGPWAQVSRLSGPLVNEVVIGLPDKNRFNASEPKDDGQFATYVTNPTLPAIISLLFGGGTDIAPTNFPRSDLVAAFLTGFAGLNQQAMVTPSEMMRLNTAVPTTPASAQINLGVAAGDLAGFPNGRRPGDDVTDIALRVVMGVLCHNLPFDANGDGNVDENDNLKVCGTTPADAEAAAPAGTLTLGDGAPQNAGQFDTTFPYLTTPIPGNRDS